MVPSFGRHSLRFTAVTGDWPGCDTSPKTILSFEQLCQSADTRLFDAVRADPGHVTSLPLVTLLASNVSHLTNILYKHDRILAVSDSLARKTFIIRMILFVIVYFIMYTKVRLAIVSVNDILTYFKLLRYKICHVTKITEGS